MHAKHTQQVSQHASASRVSLPEPLQALMVAAVREMTGNVYFQPFSGNAPCSPWGDPMTPPRTPLPIASFSQYQMPQGETEAGGTICSSASWAMACCCSSRDTPCPAKATQLCREGAGSTATWDGPPFWLQARQQAACCSKQPLWLPNPVGVLGGGLQLRGWRSGLGWGTARHPPVRFPFWLA